MLLKVLHHVFICNFVAYLIQKFLSLSEFFIPAQSQSSLQALKFHSTGVRYRILFRVHIEIICKLVHLWNICSSKNWEIMKPPIKKNMSTYDFFVATQVAGAGVLVSDVINTLTVSHTIVQEVINLVL